MECRANAPVTVKVTASKGKEKEKKKAAKVSVAAGTKGNDQLVIAGSTSYIIELSSDDEMVNV